MDYESAQEVIACLGEERKIFHYYRDRYSLGLLHHLVSRQVSGEFPLAQLRQSAYAGLLQKPRLRPLLASLGKQVLSEAVLLAHDYDPAQESFVLGLDLWGGGSYRARSRQQTSRAGCNLVLQLNFSRRHDQGYRELGCQPGLLNYRGHPVALARNTLAWARIDLDWASGTALIEEIQSDWIRRVAWLAERMNNKLCFGCRPEAPARVLGLTCSIQTTLAYCQKALSTYKPIWDEAMLWAAISFIRNELGLMHIYYHSEDSGRLFKRITGNLPPRSLYTELPRRFCFTPTPMLPEFLLNEARISKALKRHSCVEMFRLVI